MLVVMKTHFLYLSYLLRHKYYVYREGRCLRVPLGRLLIHDWSKFTPVEWGAYARRHSAGRGGAVDKEADPLDFHLAWTHHWHLNPHHWEYWLATDDQGGMYPLEMPDQFIREMVADWKGASLAKGKGGDIRPWYQKNLPLMRLAPATAVRVEQLVREQSR